jgi:hypothetical protein
MFQKIYQLLSQSLDHGELNADVTHSRILSNLRDAVFLSIFLEWSTTVVRPESVPVRQTGGNKFSYGYLRRN